MRGSGERFDYGECADCGSLWLLQVPADLGAYYGSAYYSFGSAWRQAPAWRQALKRARDAWQLWGRPWWAAPLAALSPYPELDSLRRAGLASRGKVLDVGCGDGLLASTLAAQGLNVTGIDPFLAADETALESGARLLKRDLAVMDGCYDWVLFNHSLEHMAQPQAALGEAFRLCEPGGHCLVRVPTCSSEAWRRFRGHWIQLDPPRHLVLFSREGFRRLAIAQGWEILDTFDDSGAFQFWGSLQAQQGIPLEAASSQSKGGRRFSLAQMKAFEKEAQRLNGCSDGDSMAWVLRKPTGSPVENVRRGA
jgi:SAM-dependent methyltransferase